MSQAAGNGDRTTLCMGETSKVEIYDHEHPSECGGRCAGPVDTLESTVWSIATSGEMVVDAETLRRLEAKRVVQNMIVDGAANHYGEVQR